MPATRRRTFTIGGSKGATIPWGMTIADEVSIAAGDRLLIMDTTGEVPEDKLLQFYMEHVEPAFQRWWESQKRPAIQPGGFRVMQEEAPAPVSPVKPLEAEGVAMPQPEVPLVSCFRCGQLIAWTIDPRVTATCPRCGALLRLVAIPKTGGNIPPSP